MEAPASSSGGGGGGGGICLTKWTCTDWNSCVDGTQTRTCTYPTNWCTPTTVKPVQSQSCVVTGTNVIPTDNKDNESENPGFPSSTNVSDVVITGNAVRIWKSIKN